MRDHRSSIPVLLLLFCALPLACSDDDQPFKADTLPVDGGADALLGADGGSMDTAPSPSLACNAGLDLAPLTLSADYCLVGRVGVPNSGAFALALDGAGSTYYSFEAAAGPREMVVRAYGLDLAQNSLGGASKSFGFTAAGADDFYAGFYLARFEEVLAVGYTLADYSGKVVWGLAGASPREVDAPGNFDAVYLQRDLLLVNGLGLAEEAGQGVYALDPQGGVKKVIGEMGDGSGFLARGDNILYASYYDFASGANKLYAFTLAEVRGALDAGQTLDLGAGDLVYDGDLADITASRDELIVIDASFTEFRAVRVLGATISADAVVVQSPVAIVTAEDLADAPTPTELSADGEVIGMRLGSGDEAELALVKRK